MAKLPSCAKCRWVRRDWSWLWFVWCPPVSWFAWRSTIKYARCGHPKSVEVDGNSFDVASDAVVGIQRQPRTTYQYCSTMRGRICGLDAALFEARP